MRIEAYQSTRLENRGNTGPARIAPLADSGGPAKPVPVVQPAPAIRLPHLHAFALPEVDAPDVDVQRFASMTAALLKRMETVQLWQTPAAEAELVNLSA